MIHMKYMYSSMQCTACKKILEITEFSYKNETKKIYYLHCNKCREKVTKDENVKVKQKEQYEKVKKQNVINCKCGVKYIAFREYHIHRHQNTIHHLQFSAKQ